MFALTTSIFGDFVEVVLFFAAVAAFLAVNHVPEFVIHLRR